MSTGLLLAILSDCMGENLVAVREKKPTAKRNRDKRHRQGKYYEGQL
jgi:hypothetical protein